MSNFVYFHLDPRYSVGDSLERLHLHCNFLFTRRRPCFIKSRCIIRSSVTSPFEYLSPYWKSKLMIRTSCLASFGMAINKWMDYFKSKIEYKWADTAPGTEWCRNQATVSPAFSLRVPASSTTFVHNRYRVSGGWSFTMLCMILALNKKACFWNSYLPIDAYLPADITRTQSFWDLAQICTL